MELADLVARLTEEIITLKAKNENLERQLQAVKSEAKKRKNTRKTFGDLTRSSKLPPLNAVINAKTRIKNRLYRHQNKQCAYCSKKPPLEYMTYEHLKPKFPVDQKRAQLMPRLPKMQPEKKKQFTAPAIIDVLLERLENPFWYLDDETFDRL